MNAENRDFDKEAASWDENPGRVKLANDVARAISERIALRPEMNVMDFGCGTGLLSMQLQQHVHSITGIDSSQGMLDVFNAKIASYKLKYVKTLLLDLEKGERLEGNYDLVLSNMTLHHIKDIESLLIQFYRVIAPGGYLCIADLDLDSGQFHSDDTGVFHFGFERKRLQEIFTRIGFKNVWDITATEVIKPAKNGQLSRFTVFLMCGQKK